MSGYSEVLIFWVLTPFIFITGYQQCIQNSVASVPWIWKQ